MESVTPERINRAIAWYRQHQSDVEAALPLQTQGRLFKAGWPDALERSIALWESGYAPVNLADIYIYRPIVLVAQVLTAKSQSRDQLSD